MAGFKQTRLPYHSNETHLITICWRERQIELTCGDKWLTESVDLFLFFFCEKVDNCTIKIEKKKRESKLMIMEQNPNFCQVNIQNFHVLIKENRFTNDRAF